MVTNVIIIVVLVLVLFGIVYGYDHINTIRNTEKMLKTSYTAQILKLRKENIELEKEKEDFLYQNKILEHRLGCLNEDLGRYQELVIKNRIYYKEKVAKLENKIKYLKKENEGLNKHSEYLKNRNKRLIQNVNDKPERVGHKQMFFDSELECMPKFNLVRFEKNRIYKYQCLYSLFDGWEYLVFDDKSETTLKLSEKEFDYYFIKYH